MPTKEEIAAEAKSIFCKTLKLEPDRIQPDSRLQEDLDLDSLDMIEVVYEVEDRFDVQIPEERVQEIRTFAEIVDGLHDALQAKG